MIDVSSFLQNSKIDAFLLSQFYNILYATGFETLSPQEREAYVLFIGEKKIIITDSRYEGGEHNIDSEIYILMPGERAIDVISKLCDKHSIQTIGCEADDLRWSEIQMLQKLSFKLIPIQHALSSYRSIKSEEEIFAIKQACHIGDLVLKDITPYIHPGQTEKEIAWYIEKSIREGYKAELAFDPIVAIDEHAALPHYNTKNGEGSVKDGSILLIDFGVKAHNYCSDITRMVGVGSIHNEIKNAYKNLLEVQTKTIEKIKNESELSKIDLFCREELQKKNVPIFTHSTGHGVGLEVHEGPRVSVNSLDYKKDGQVFTVEPGIYIHGKWGMRIEDTLTILDQGGVEILTRFPKELILL